jgi:formyltetrahydrofolate hydrolase
MAWRVALAAARPKVAILVSQYDHCLADLLYRHSTGELACEIPLVISNHTDVARSVVRDCGDERNEARSRAPATHLAAAPRG